MVEKGQDRQGSSLVHALNSSIGEHLMIHNGEKADDTSGPTKEAKDIGADQEENDVARARSLSFRLQKYGFRKFPSFIPDPERHELLQMYRRYDAADNAKSEPPSGEVIESRCVWAIEFYTPSQISKLLRGFEESRLEY